MKMDGAKSTRASWMNECTEFGLNECEATGHQKRMYMR